MKQPIRGLRNNAILTNAQVSLLEEFAASDLKNVFRLTGGTALSAFYLEHRFSEDLDFFSHEKIPWYLPEHFLKSLRFVQRINHTKLFDRNIFTLTLQDGTVLKTEFTYFSLMNLEAHVVIDELHVDGFLALTVNKLCAIADRFDTKDYVDVYCAFTFAGLDIREMFTLAERKCGATGVRHILKNRSLQIPDGVEHLPLRISLEKHTMERFFRAHIKKIFIHELSLPKPSCHGKTIPV